MGLNRSIFKYKVYFSFFRVLQLYSNVHYSIYYRMYDVYNNAMILGGQLNVNFDQYLVTRRDGSNFFTQSKRFQSSKYAYRAKMVDVTLRVGVVVIVLKMFLSRFKDMLFHYFCFIKYYSYQTMKDFNRMKNESITF